MFTITIFLQEIRPHLWLTLITFFVKKQNIRMNEKDDNGYMGTTLLYSKPITTPIHQSLFFSKAFLSLLENTLTLFLHSLSLTFLPNQTSLLHMMKSNLSCCFLYFLSCLLLPPLVFSHTHGKLVFFFISSIFFWLRFFWALKVYS